MVPIAGHVLRVEAPWVGNVLIDSRSNNLPFTIFPGLFFASSASFGSEH